MKPTSWLVRIVLGVGCLGLLMASAVRADVGVRALGMGGAFVAVADDSTATYWNPAGLVQLQAQELSFSRNLKKKDRPATQATLEFRDFVNKDVMQENFLTYARPLGEKAAVGLLWISDKTHFDSPSVPFITQDTFGLSYGTRIDEMTSIGVSVRFVNTHQEIRATVPSGNNYGASATGTGFDIGLLRKINEQWQVGLLLQDVTRTTLDDTFYKQTYTTNLNVRPGIAYRPKENLLIALDIFNLNKDGVDKDGRELKTKVAVGVEGRWPINPETGEGMLIGRLGSYLDSITVGVGYGNHRTRVDFAYIGGKHEVGQLSITFGF